MVSCTGTLLVLMFISPVSKASSSVSSVVLLTMNTNLTYVTMLSAPDGESVRIETGVLSTNELEGVVNGSPVGAT